MDRVKYSNLNSILYFTLLINAVLLHAQILEGDNCDITDANDGVCKPVFSCASSIDTLSDFPPVFCNLQAKEPIVCCPLKPEEADAERRRLSKNRATRRPSNREPPNREPPEHIMKTISYKKCVEYAKHVYTYEKSPLPFEPEQRKSQCGIDLKPLIVGGEPAAIKEFPHMVALGYSSDLSDDINWNCGGSLISGLYVLTAAHCLIYESKNNPHIKGPVVAKMGMVNLQKFIPGLQEYKIVEGIPHPKYTHTKYHDIALLELDKPVKFTAYVRPACLHVGKEIIQIMAYATGWGKNDSESDAGTDDLMKVKLSIIDVDACNRTYTRKKNRQLKNGIIDELQICAGEYNKDKDTCQGDSGGPLQVYHRYEYCMYDLIGITSFGLHCGSSPAVYTRVSNYVPWIEGIVWG